MQTDWFGGTVCLPMLSTFVIYFAYIQKKKKKKGDSFMVQ